jgi:hypothetical protein
VSAFATMWRLATTASAQNRVQFGGLSTWELTQGVAVQTPCEVTLIDEVMDRTATDTAERVRFGTSRAAL